MTTFKVGQKIKGLGTVTAIVTETFPNGFVRRYLEIDGQQRDKIEIHEQGEACHIFGDKYYFSWDLELEVEEVEAKEEPEASIKLDPQYHLTQTERSQIKLGLSSVALIVGLSWKNKVGSKVYEITEVMGNVLRLVVKTKEKDGYGRILWRTQKVTATII